MSEMTASEIEKLRKQLMFRAWHRGTREMDFLMGTFAQRYINDFTPDQLIKFKAMIEVSDPELYNWRTGAEPVPADMQHDVMLLLMTHDWDYENAQQGGQQEGAADE
ncbi:MAG: succinate dehydrogenase assembly factor 2 [Alphaproteobacteria bacterium]